MKQFFHKSLAVFMASVVFMTTMSFTMDMHYCGDTLVDFSFTQQVETCGMENTQNTSNCENPTLSEKSCCTDTQVIKKGQDDLKVSFDKLSLEQQIFVASFTYSYISLFEGTASEEIPFFDYAPPFVERDVQVLHQTFLI
ncbi:hypothetical protein ESY86_02800 [Subsaximicrobium wynnwilliamsii]|uniref:Secreted protein n=1 Tax=Subsaximicrobium wynnwilliamsii TaxID=291179 RepID=A0A5C6ZM81_9FLAO|nr:hypothetical protein [Subsaximicrobium wynnwilliamsii]TXD85549.1 hypothetical protein ESY87_01110 [Subsaximicrobium wynnwilliamsii]TXD90902.1 hypothetical protein ESY86_02800 [Subsaximicrobium wynnwilliamsii]TXE05409.1 hypothetical protein ESY88_01110 [Subsaximicrobium wynnwilliamsii]